MDPDSKTAVVASPPTGDTKLADQTYSFSPSGTLDVQSLGVSLFRLPLPQRELNTHIVRGTLTTYTSTRHKKCSGNCTLIAHPSLNEVAVTTYFFGPGKKRNPVVSLLQKDGRVDEIRIVSSGIFSRNAHFEFRGERWEWVHEKDIREGLKTVLLALYRAPSAAVPRAKVAEFIRNDDTRTEGSNKYSAGNGGLLVFNTEGVDEVLLVATLCVMLKKEVDRRRCIQAMVLMGGGV